MVTPYPVSSVPPLALVGASGGYQAHGLLLLSQPACANSTRFYHMSCFATLYTCFVITIPVCYLKINANVYVISTFKIPILSCVQSI